MPHPLLDEILASAGLGSAGDDVEIAGADPVFPIPFRASEAGAAAIAAAAIGAAELWQARTGRRQGIHVDVDASAAALRSNRYLRRPGALEPENGIGLQRNIFRTGDGHWIYLHREFAHHRGRIAALLGCGDSLDELSRTVAAWNSAELEEAVFAAGACAGMIRTREEWQAHPQGRAIASLPLIEISKVGDSRPEWPKAGPRPLSGIRVLDLTRVLAGPTCARTLAEHGAEVLRIGAPALPNKDEHIIDTGHGKRSAVLDLSTATGADRLKALIKGADVFSQSYRPGSLASRGFSPEAAAKLRPGIVYVSLSAFGHLGPWANRRGFDTLVQTVSGFADEYAIDGKPRLLPVSALDYITGYVAAFGVMVALHRRALEGGSYHVRLSLAQIGRWLDQLGRIGKEQWVSAPEDLPEPRIRELTITTDTPFGQIVHLAPVAQMSDTPPGWERPAVPLDHDSPAWLTARTRRPDTIC